MKGKKLPDLWVGFRQGTAWEVFYQKPAIKNPGVEYTTARYTPAKPAKVCRWTPHKRQPGNWILQCEGERNPTEISPYRFNYKFCPYCGGKIKVVR